MLDLNRATVLTPKPYMYSSYVGDLSKEVNVKSYITLFVCNIQVLTLKHYVFWDSLWSHSKHLLSSTERDNLPCRVEMSFFAVFLSGQITELKIRLEWVCIEYADVNPSVLCYDEYKCLYLNVDCPHTTAYATALCPCYNQCYQLQPWQLHNKIHPCIYSWCYWWWFCSFTMSEIWHNEYTSYMI